MTYQEHSDGTEPVTIADIFPLDPQMADATPLDRWRGYGFDPTGDRDAAQCPVPTGTVALHFDGTITRDELNKVLMEAGAAPLMWLRTGSADIVLYRYAGKPLPNHAAKLHGLVIRQAGELIPLPAGEDITRSKVQVESIATLPVIEADGIDRIAAMLSIQTEQATPLQQYSMRGRSEAFAKHVENEKPLLGNVCTSGQATVWYAPPNAGKTLITLSLLIEAISERRIIGPNVYYVAADDTASGLAAKMSLLDDYGVHTLVPGFMGFNYAHIAANLTKMAETDQASGVLVILDTLKKFVDLMKKSDSAQFANICRKFVLAGGSILALAHTTKNALSDGKLQFAGTSDIMDDFDAGYVMQPQESRTSAGEKVVLFEMRKRRGGGVDSAAYSYDDRRDTPYLEKLASVTEVSADQLDGIVSDARQLGDADMIAEIASVLTEQSMNKMDLARAVAKRVSVGRNAVVKVIERYTGVEPAKHYWQYKVGDRGAKIYTLLPKAEHQTLN